MTVDVWIFYEIWDQLLLLSNLNKNRKQVWITLWNLDQFVMLIVLSLYNDVTHFSSYITRVRKEIFHRE